jgi:hypothetical protein
MKLLGHVRGEKESWKKRKLQEIVSPSHLCSPALVLQTAKITASASLSLK